MLYKILYLSIALFLMSGCSQPQITTDYDTQYKFEGNTKYVIAHNYKPGENTLVDDRIKNALMSTLNAKHYAEVAKDKADLVFVFHTNVQDKTDIQTDYQMIGYGGYGFARGFGGGIVATTNAYNYTEGTLVVDAINPKTQKIVWRGIAKDELNEKGTPQEITEYINQVVAKLMEKFPPREAK